MLCPFREDIDPESLAEYDVWDADEKLCAGRAVWKISKVELFSANICMMHVNQFQGQLIDETTKFCHEVEVTTSNDEDPSFSADIFSCRSEIPPDYVSDPGTNFVVNLLIDQC